MKISIKNINPPKKTSSFYWMEPLQISIVTIAVSINWVKSNFCKHIKAHCYLHFLIFALTSDRLWFEFDFLYWIFSQRMLEYVSRFVKDLFNPPPIPSLTIRGGLYYFSFQVFAHRLFFSSLYSYNKEKIRKSTSLNLMNKVTVLVKQSNTYLFILCLFFL